MEKAYLSPAGDLIVFAKGKIFGGSGNEKYTIYISKADVDNKTDQSCNDAADGITRCYYTIPYTKKVVRKGWDGIFSDLLSAYINIPIESFGSWPSVDFSLPAKVNRMVYYDDKDDKVLVYAERDADDGSMTISRFSITKKGMRNPLSIIFVPVGFVIDVVLTPVYIIVGIPPLVSGY